MIVLLILLATAWWVVRAIDPDRPAAVAGLWILAAGAAVIGIFSILGGFR